MPYLPTELCKYRNEIGRFYTYFGSIYVGFIFEHEKIPGFLIVPPFKKTELDQRNKTLEEFKSIGYHIPDPRIIRWHEPSVNALINTDNIPKQYSPRKKIRRLHIFGAGASSYCIGANFNKEFCTDPLHPPLGCNLFDARFDSIAQDFLGIEALLSVFEINDSNIEKAFQAEWKRISESYDKRRLSKLISVQYYLQSLFEKISFNMTGKHKRYNMYAQLFQTLLDNKSHDETIAVVSFNYDTLIEDKLSKLLHTDFDNISRYADFSSDFALFKPHGSCNWGWAFRVSEFLEKSMNAIPSTFYKNQTDLYDIYFKHLGSPDQIVSKYGFGYEHDSINGKLGFQSIDKEQIKVIERTDKFYPAMLVPFADKDELLMPYSHMTKLDLAFDQIEDIICIGWKGNERTFNQKLEKAHKNLKRLTIVDPDLEGVKSNLGQYLDLNSLEVIHFETFEDYVRSITKY